MTKLPKLDIILAGFLAQISVRLIIYIEDESNQFPYLNMYEDGANVCKSDRILWLALILISVGVAIITTWRNKEDKYIQGTIAFVVSFLFNLAGDSLGFLAISCTAGKWNLYKHVDLDTLYSKISIALTSIALIGISVHLWKKPATLNATKFPDIEVILLGVCAHFTVWHIASVIGLKSDYSSFCDNRGLGSWLHLLALSVTLAIVPYLKGTGNILVTFFSSFLLNLIVGGTGRLAIVCGIDASDMFYYGYEDEISTVTGRVYSNVSMIVNAVLALGITVWYFKSFTKSSSNPPEMESEEIPIQLDDAKQDTSAV